MSDTSDADPLIVRLAPAVAARLVGLAFLVLAVTTFAVTALVLIVGWAPDLIVLVLVVELVAVFVGACWLRSRAYVVRLDDRGYSVRLVRGAGVQDGRWSEVTEAVAAHPRDVPCLVLKRSDGTTTSIPVGMLAIDRDDFAREVGTRLTRAQGSR
ncbi:hypothetical protein BH09ACT12_BH09ACT12_13730 [soil metagenome]